MREPRNALILRACIRLPLGHGKLGMRSRVSFLADLLANDGGSVSCGSGWSVPCVSIQLTLSQYFSKA